jgi:hypothetical protein
VEIRISVVKDHRALPSMSSCLLFQSKILNKGILKHKAKLNSITYFLSRSLYNMQDGFMTKMGAKRMVKSVSLKD